MTIKNAEINPGLDWYNRWPRNVTCAARKVDDLVFIGGQLPLDSEGNVVGVGNVQEQTRFALTKFKECIELAGGSMGDVIEVQSFHTDMRHVPAVLEVDKDFFNQSKPTWGAIGTSGLDKQEIDVCISGLAVLNAKTKDINPGLEWYNKPPWDVSVPCKVANDLVIMAQMCAMDEKGNVIAPGDILEQSRYTVKKISECMKLAGGTDDNRADIVKYTRDRRAQLAQAVVFTDSMIRDKKRGGTRIEEISGTSITMPGFFHPDLVGQVRVCGVLGDIEKISLGGWAGWYSFWPCDMSPGAIKVGRYVFTCGQVMFNELFYEPTLEVDVPSIKKQARYAFNEFVRILNSIGATMDNMVFIQPYTASWYQEAILEVAHEFFHNEKPALIPSSNSGLYLPTHLVEIYGMAIVED